MSIIKYYCSFQGEGLSDIFLPYIWREHGLGTLLDGDLQTDYGNDLNLLLIQYFVSNSASDFKDPYCLKIGNYSKKLKDIRVPVAVTLPTFCVMSEVERRMFITISTLNAIEAVRVKLEKKKMDIDFDRLLIDVKRITQKYIKR